MTKATFLVHAKDHNKNMVLAQGWDDGTIIVRNGGDAIELPAELVCQVRAELENQALDRVAAYARERAEDMIVARDRTTDAARRRRYEHVADAFREMAAKALGEKETT